MSWLKGLLVLVVFGVVACSHDAKEAEDLQSEGNGLIGQINTSVKAKAESGIDLTGGEVSKKKADKYPWQLFYPTSEDRKKVRLELYQHIKNIERVLEIAHHKNMKLEGDESRLQNSRQQALTYISSLESYDPTLIPPKN